MHPPVRTSRVAGGLVAATLLLFATACGAGASGSTPKWVPQQDYASNSDPQPNITPPDNGPGVPGPAPSSPGAAPTGPSTSPSTPATDPSVLATKLDQPTGLIVLPDGTALVGERTTGRIFRVQPVAGRPVVLVQTLAGVDGRNGGGLLDLAISQTFSQDALIYAYLSTATDNRVVHFTLGATPTPIITGIPKGVSDNQGRIAFDATGALLTGTSDAGQAALADSPSSLAGKILRTNDIGQPAPDNPTPSSPVYASGLRSVDGLCLDLSTGTAVAISAAGATPATPDEINIIKAGADYGWPADSTNSVGPAASLPSASSGGAGCALQGGQLSVATTTGRSVVSATVKTTGVTGLVASLTGRYGRLRTVVAGSDGALWLTTSNRDGKGTPIANDDRVIRIDGSLGGSRL